MWDEYYDMYNEPSQLDIIVDEALSKIQENVKELVKLKLEKLAKLDEDIDEKSKEIVNLEYKLLTAQKNLSEVEKKVEESEDRMPAKYIDRFIHDAIGNFAPGDKVWVVSAQYQKRTCCLCKGSGKVLIAEPVKTEITCPQCSGSGQKTFNKYIVKEDKIYNIILKLNFKNHRVRNWSTENIYLYSLKNSSTSIDRIFENKIDAEKECERLNNKN